MAAADRSSDILGGQVELPSNEQYRRLIRTALTELGGRATRHAITARALELGSFSPHQLSVPPPPTHARYASMIEYRLSWAMTHLKQAGVIENPERGIWALPSDGLELATTEPGEAVDVSEQRLNELALMPYREYLRTPEWRTRREAALARADHSCHLDKRHRANLEVHHNTYERRGRELPSDLVVLCNACHSKHHNKRPRRAVSDESTSVPPPTVLPANPVKRVTQRRGLYRKVLAAGVAVVVLAVGAGMATTEQSQSSAPRNAYDCGDVSFAQAQRLLAADASDPHRLDADGDGVACDSGR